MATFKVAIFYISLIRVNYFPFESNMYKST
ncbi:Uncharacterised protein [Flavobacterium hibernum]|nr:Uncharacterised protein [Flavobacterium hibernum]